MKANKLPSFIYLALVIVSFIIYMGEKMWGAGTTLSLLLTLPWSVSMVIFMEAIAHDVGRSLMLILIPFAALNFFLLYRMPDWLKKGRENGNKPAA